MSGPVINASTIGFDYPHGRPDRLLAAGRAWEAVADKLDGKARTLNAASSTALGLDWSGKAARAYADYSLTLSNAFVMGASVCHECSFACRRFAHELEHAQHQADGAMVDAMAAIESEYAAQTALTAANAKLTDAAHDRASLDAAAAAATAAGPVAQAATSAALAPQRAAVAARATTAAGERSHAQDRVRRAHADLVDARRRGKAAKRHADNAAQRAARTFEFAAGVAAEPPRLGQPPVPVSVRPRRPGEHGLTPSDIRVKQIDQEKEHDGERYPWLGDALKDAGQAQGVSSAIGQAAAVGATILDDARNRDDLLRNGPGGISRALTRAARNPIVRGAGRTPVALPLGFALGLASATAEGRQPLDAAGKALTETAVGTLGAVAVGLACASTVVSGPVGAGACVVGITAMSVGGGMAGGALYDKLSPPPKHKGAPAAP